MSQSRYTPIQTSAVTIRCVMDTAMIPAYAIIMRLAGGRLFYELGGEPLEVDSHRDVDAIPAGHPFRLSVSPDALEELAGALDAGMENASEDLAESVLQVYRAVEAKIYG